jgi:hypothetical protein
MTKYILQHDFYGHHYCPVKIVDEKDFFNCLVKKETNLEIPIVHKGQVAEYLFETRQGIYLYCRDINISVRVNIVDFNEHVIKVVPKYHAMWLSLISNR